MLKMADMLKDKKRFEIMAKEDSTDQYKNKIADLQKKAKDILKEMEEYSKNHKSSGVVAFA